MLVLPGCLLKCESGVNNVIFYLSPSTYGFTHVFLHLPGSCCYLLSFVLPHYFLSFCILLFLFLKFVVGMEEGWRVTVNEYGISFCDDRNVLKLIKVMAT